MRMVWYSVRAAAAWMDTRRWSSLADWQAEPHGETSPRGPSILPCEGVGIETGPQHLIPPRPATLGEPLIHLPVKLMPR